MTQYRVKSNSIIHETINDEAVIVNLESGTYFSLDGNASFVWDALTAGHPLDAVTTSLAARFALPPAVAADHLRTLVDQLLLYDLLAEAQPGAVAVPAAPVAPPAMAGTAAFAGMTLNVYRDMEELLMLDPIHDVTAAGWPHTPPKT
ncbi:MAG: PqqD family protein [Alphaproteobacteria bacterium]